MDRAVAKQESPAKFKIRFKNATDIIEYNLTEGHYRCLVCRVTLNSGDLESHCFGLKHRKNVLKEGFLPREANAALGIKMKKQYNCTFCGVFYNSKARFEEHQLSKKHTDRLLNPSPRKPKQKLSDNHLLKSMRWMQKQRKRRKLKMMELAEVGDGEGVIGDTRKMTKYVANTRRRAKVANTRRLTEVDNTRKMAKVADDLRGMTDAFDNTRRMMEVVNTRGMTEVNNTRRMAEVVDDFRRMVNVVDNTRRMTGFVYSDRGMMEVINTRGMTEFDNTRRMDEVVDDARRMTDVDSTRRMTDYVNNARRMTEFVNNSRRAEFVDNTTTGMTEVIGNTDQPDCNASVSELLKNKDFMRGVHAGIEAIKILKAGMAGVVPSGETPALATVPRGETPALATDSRHLGAPHKLGGVSCDRYHWADIPITQSGKIPTVDGNTVVRERIPDSTAVVGAVKNNQGIGFVDPLTLSGAQWKPEESRGRDSVVGQNAEALNSTLFQRGDTGFDISSQQVGDHASSSGGYKTASSGYAINSSRLAASSSRHATCSGGYATGSTKYAVSSSRFDEATSQVPEGMFRSSAVVGPGQQGGRNFFGGSRGSNPVMDLFAQRDFQQTLASGLGGIGYPPDRPVFP